EHRFKPAMSQATRERKLKGWARAVKGVLASDEGERHSAICRLLPSAYPRGGAEGQPRPLSRSTLLQRAIAGLYFASRHLDRPVIVGERCIVVLLSRISCAAEAIGVGVIGLDLDLSGKVGDRAIKIALVRVGLSPQ